MNHVARHLAQVSLLAFALQASAVCHDVYIIAGQSNMDGRGETKFLTGPLARYAKPQTDVDFYYANPIRSPDPLKPRYESGWRALTPGYAIPPNYTNNLPSGRFGPEISLGRTLADANPGCHIALIKVTQGNTSLAKHWSPENHWLYLTLTNTVAKALADLHARGDTYTLKALIWHQGESDVTGGPEKYTELFTNFIQTLRHDLAAPALPVVIGEIATTKDPAFRARQQELATRIPNATFVSSTGLHTIEGTHFDTPGVLQLGERFAAETGKLLSTRTSANATPPLAAAQTKL